jgi:hypothetical protein
MHTVDSNRTLSTLENDVEFAFLEEAVRVVFTCLPKYTGNGANIWRVNIQ